MGGHQAVTLVHGGSRYARLLHQIGQDSALVAAMWAHAESRPEELDMPGTSWTVVLADGVPAAWCAARVQADGTLKCHSNYEVPAYRGRGLYEAAYRARHLQVIQPSDLEAVTYLFPEPIDLHEEDGWYRTGAKGPGELDGHQWWELRRPRQDPRTELPA